MSSRSPNEVGTRLPERIVVGRVRRAHGVRGELLVEVLSDAPGRFAPGSELELVTADGGRRAVRVVAARPHRAAQLVHLEGVTSRELAEALHGARFEAPRATTPAAPDGAYYYFELVGCTCSDAELGELGVVSEVIEDGGGLLLEVDSAAGRLLVPFARRFVEKVDVRGRAIRLRLPEGLIETCVSPS